MGMYVRYAPDNRELDLAELSPADHNLITGLCGQVARGDQVLTCLDSTPGSDELYISRRDGQYVAEHFVDNGHAPHEVARESDEHLWQKDYWFRAAQDSGHVARRAYRTGMGTVLDVAIKGDQQTGIDIQRSDVSPSRAANRTLKSYRSGWLTLWFADSDRSPRWLHRVPSVSCNRMSWRRLPARRKATATGLRVVEPLKCTPGAFGRCPAGKRRPCGLYHPNFVPWHQVTVDDLAAMVPEDQAMPVQTNKGYVYLVPPGSQKMYYELTGVPGVYVPGAPVRQWTSPGPQVPPRVVPVRPRQVRAGPRCEGCGQLLLLVRPDRTHCQACRPMPMGPSW